MAGYSREGLTVDDYDQLESALDKLEFVRAALTDCDNPMGNDSASTGLTLVMGEALDVVREHVDGITTRVC